MARQARFAGQSRFHEEPSLILVDSSVWIDYFKGIEAAHTDKLDWLLGRELLAAGDLILVEVLQGFDNEREFERARHLLFSLVLVQLGGMDVAIQAARNLRALRKLGITVRRMINLLIATSCIESGYELLHNDRDFDPFALHLGLRVVT